MDETTPAAEVNPFDALDEGSPQLPEETPELPEAPGQIAPGTIQDIWHRPILKNDDGSISTTLSFSIGTDDGETLIPQVVNGKKLTREEAIAHYRETGEHLGTFDTPEDADSYAEALHNAQWDYIQKHGGPQADEPNPFDALDTPDATGATHKAMSSALELADAGGPDVTISAKGGAEASWSDVAAGIPTAIGGKIESKLAGVQEYRGRSEAESAKKKLWQSMILPEAVRNARDKGIPLTEDDQVVDIARHLGIRPDQFTRDWPDYANQSDAERRDFQATQRQRLAKAQPNIEEGSARRKTAADVSERYRPNMPEYSPKSLAFDTATMIPDLLGGTAATLATGPVGGAAFMAADIAPDEYAAARNQGLDHRSASTYATLSTLAASVPEIPVFRIIDSAPAAKKIIGGVVGEKFAGTVPGKVIGTSVAQGVTQATVQALQEGIDEGFIDRKDSLAEALKKIAFAGVTGAVAGVPMGALHAGLHREPKPTTFQDITATGESAAGDRGQAPESAPATTIPQGGAEPAQPEGAPPAQRPIPALIEPEQAPVPIQRPETAKQGTPDDESAAPTLAGADLHAALDAVQKKTVSPGQLESLEAMGLATRSDLNVPRLLPKGRRELTRALNQRKATVPEAQQVPVDNTDVPRETGGIAPESAPNQPEIQKKTEIAPIEAPKPAETSQIGPEVAKRGRPAIEKPPEPSGKGDLSDETSDALVAMKRETGWAQVGGRVVRNEETGQVTGRTAWIPNAEWWPDRPKGLTEPQVHKAIDKAVAGQKLSPREQRMVDFMRDVHDQRQKLDPFLPERADMPTDYELPKSNTVPVDDAHETAMVARLAELDEGALESYAKQHEDDRQGFLRAVKAHLDAHDGETTGAGRKGREAEAVAEGGKPYRPGADLFGQDTGRQQELADETRRRDQARSPNKDVSPDIGRAGDLFSTNANRQTDLVDATQGGRERVKRHGEIEEGAIVRIHKPGHPEHGNRARVMSIFRHRPSDDFVARVSHESDNHQFAYDLPELKPLGQQDLVEQLERARGETNTEPTEAQKAAGNYAKGVVDFGGMKVALENPRGSTRSGKSDGRAWRRKMHADYGYVKGTEGKDGDAVDVFMTGNPDSGKVFVINQNHADGTFDEHKAVLGASTKQEAEALYLKHYPKGWKGLGSTAELSTEAFKEWVNSKHTKQPMRTGERRADTASRKRVTEMTPAEMRKELLTHELTKIPNRRAYIEADKLPTQVSIDVDSLKWVNDNMGHESGNALLKAIAESLAQHSDLVYHLSGDEFALQALHEREAHEVMAKIAEQLKGATIEVEMPDGKIVKLNGLGVSYGVGKDLHEADAKLQTHKARREKEGTRAPRGEAPPGATVGAREEGGEDKTGGVAEEKADLAPSGTRDETERKLNDLLGAAIKRRLMEEQGQDLLDELSEKGTHPRSVNDQFWKDTYWKLNAENQRRFQRYAKSLGFEPGNTLSIDREGKHELARDWQHVGEFLGEDLPADAGDLEGITRGYVALMKWANDQAEKASNEAPDRLMLREDEAAYSPLSPLTGGVEDRRVKPAPGQGSLDFFAPRENPTPAARAARAQAAETRAPQAVARGAPRGGGNRTALVNTGHFTSKVQQVRDWRDAAHILAPLRKEPRESVMALVTDATGKPLAIIRHTTGTSTSSNIELHTLYGAIARVPGARKVWMGHNHPSGLVQQSPADMQVLRRIRELSQGTGIDVQGSIVVGPGNRNASLVTSERYQEPSEVVDRIRPMSRLRGQALPIQERRLTRIQPLKGDEAVTTTTAAVRAVRETKTPRGVVMLNAKNEVVGHVPITEQEMTRLRTGSTDTGTARILKEFESANAQQAIIFGESPRLLGNVGTMLKAAGIRTLETVLRDEAGNLRALGGGVENEGHYFSTREAPAPGMKREDLERVVHQTISQSGLGARFPHVEVHEDRSSLPPALRAQADRGGEPSAIFDPRTGRIHMLASGNATELEARSNLWHEAVGHYGLRAAMDEARYNEVMDGIYRDMPERVQATAYRNGLDLNNPVQRRVAAEEVVAYAAGQIMTGQAVDKPFVPLWTQVVRAVRAFFAKVTGKPFYDERTIAGLVQEAHTALERGTSFSEAGEAARSQHAERFYSPVERAVGESKQAKASADQWLATIKKMAGVKPEELEWLGLEPWLKEHTGPVTKTELQDYIRANRLELEETDLASRNHGQEALTNEQILEIHDKLEAGGFDELDQDSREALANGGQQTAGVLEHLANRVGIDVGHMVTSDRSPATRKRSRMAEELRAEGHLVTFADDGNLESIHVLRPADGGPAYQVHLMRSLEQIQSLPDKIRDRVKALIDVAEEVATERANDTSSNGSNQPQFEEYTLPGGKNYHELLLRLPESPTRATRYNIFNDKGVLQWQQAGSREEAETLANRVGGTFKEITSSDAANYRSPHFEQANVLAHVRFKERTDADGKRVLFLEELQSDWHQQGRDRGYPQDADTIRAAEVKRNEAGRALVAATDLVAATKATMELDPTVPRERLMEAIRERAAAQGRLTEVQRDLDKTKGAVPHAPFKTSWPMLTMKRMVRWAAEHGFDRVAWTTGAQQNERYNLAQHIDKITYSRDVDGMYWLYVEGKDGRGAAPDLQNEPLTKEKVAEYVGQELADKMERGEGKYESVDTTQPFPERSLSGLDLTVGGEGMKGFYDDILPRETNKLIKKFGGKVADTAVHVGNTWADEAGQFRGEMVPEVEPAHGFDITPQMREAALSQGFPLFARQSQLPLQQAPKKGFYERVRKAVDYLMENPVTKDVRRLVHPVGLSDEAKQAARTARGYLGSQAAWGQRSQEELEHFSRAIDKLPVQDQLDIMDRIEHGQPQAHPELQPAADAMRKMLDTWREKVRGLGIGALDNFIEDYFPHYWADPRGAKRLVASIQGRRPLKGPASFLKVRTIPTIKEGMDAGLKPLTVNPLTMTLLKTREMQRFVTGVTLMKQFKEDGLAVFLKAGNRMPDGWAPINDNIAKVRSWSEEEGGWIERGQYVMPEDAARVINNHVSASWLKNFAPAQAFRVTANLLNAMQLGFSAFHLGFTTLDAIISKTALGIESLAHGDIGKAVHNFGEVTLGPLAAVNNLRRGHQLLQAYTNPVGATPELAKIVKALETAGGRAHMDRYYQIAEGISPFRGVGVRSLAKDIHSALTKPGDKLRNVAGAVGNFAPEYANKLFRSLQALGRTHTALEIPFELAGRIVRSSTAWIMEHLVPMQKLGVFSDLAKAHIDRHPNEDPHAQADSLQRIWASVDNRLGEMVYDNLFWNRTFKDTLHFGIRAVGWNVGTVREIAGAPIDAMKIIDKAIRGGRITADDLGHKIPYVLAMTMTTAIYGAMLNYLYTGEGPSELKDYFFPKTGGSTNYGTPQRVSLPSYVKDVYEYSQRPGHTVMNKLNPIFNVIGEMWTNEDFFGNPITDPDAGFWESFGQRAKFVGGEMTPFSLQGRQQLETTDKDTGVIPAVKRTLPMVGITPAPGYVTSPDQMERRERSDREKKYVSHLKYLMNKAVSAKDADEVKRLRQEYADALMNQKKTEMEVMKDRAKAAVSRRKAATSMRNQGLPATAALVASLPLDPDADAREFFKQQTEEAA